MEYVKENVPARPPVPVWVVVCGLLATMVALVGVTTLVDHTLPPPLTRRDAPPDRFIAEIAYEHLVNITNIGPRVAGTYENEVAAVSVLVAAAKEIARAASPHNVVDIDLQRASGGFSLSFFDGGSTIHLSHNCWQYETAGYFFVNSVFSILYKSCSVYLTNPPYEALT
ncbi:unnamed protein product [Diatraea saccharalis]|uniref:Uncharacterized protein n=1 Tax=Diatraea saccharalis TaxID=40085 RepID=A0A9N9RGE5_9NEOP|nr:unnamed protein product [Diatraea saccharalis]